jgi:hypothetical protein
MQVQAVAPNRPRKAGHLERGEGTLRRLERELRRLLIAAVLALLVSQNAASVLAQPVPLAQTNDSSPGACETQACAP